MHGEWRGNAKSFFAGSICFLKQGRVKNEPCVVKSYVKEKQRWAVALLHPRFEGREVLVREEKLKFEYFVADLEFAPPIPSNLFSRSLIQPSPTSSAVKISPHLGPFPEGSVSFRSLLMR